MLVLPRDAIINAVWFYETTVENNAKLISQTSDGLPCDLSIVDQNHVPPLATTILDITTIPMYLFSDAYRSTSLLSIVR